MTSPAAAPAKPKVADAVAAASTNRIRAAIVDFARWACTAPVEPFWHYEQSRPIPVDLGARRKLPIKTDCSGFVTIAYKAAGAPDPNGYGYTGAGYTGSLLAHMRRLPSIDKAKAGDVIVYGDKPGHHAVIVIEPGPDPLVASHGTERGPFLLKHSLEAKYQKGRPAVALTIL